MADQWFIRRDGKTVGPMPSARLKQLAAAGKLKPTDLVQKEGTDRFVRAGAVKGLFPEATESEGLPAAPGRRRLTEEEGSPRSSAAAPGSRTRNSAWIVWAGLGAGSALAGLVALLAVAVLFVVARTASQRQAALGTSGTEGPQLVSPELRLKWEYTQFAEHASMEWGTETLLLSYRRMAPWRAKKLQALQLTHPALRKAVEEFAVIASMYDASVKLRQGSNWSGDEQREILRQFIRAGNEDELDAAFGDVLKGTLDKVRLLELSNRLAFRARVRHSRLWRDTLPLAKQFSGPERRAFPLRFGTLWARNISEKPLTNLTIALETSASSELPVNARLHVVFFERLDPDEWEVLPGWLISKLWNGRTYNPSGGCFRCSIWADEACFEDVSFDLRALDAETAAPGVDPAKVYRWGFFPDGSFRGTYDTSKPWVMPWVMPGARANTVTLASNKWVGRDNSTGQAFEILILQSTGPSFQGINTVGDKESSRLIAGKLRDGKIEWEPAALNRGDLGLPHWGTIDGDRMELSYGRDHVSAGTVSLRAVRPRPRSRP